MAKYCNESDLIQAIICERDKIPLTVPCAPYELLDCKANSFGQAQRSGIRIALRCINKTPAADVVEVVRCKDCTEWDEKECECSHWYGFRENDFCSNGVRKNERSF